MIKRSQVTITDIAKYVGMTNMTVSRALKQPEKVRPETREKYPAQLSGSGYHSVARF